MSKDELTDEEKDYFRGKGYTSVEDTEHFLREFILQKKILAIKPPNVVETKVVDNA